VGIEFAFAGIGAAILGISGAAAVHPDLGLLGGGRPLLPARSGSR
jgi:hypothetical protein